MNDASSQVNDPFTCPSHPTGRSRAGKSATCPSAPPPYKGAGEGAGTPGRLLEYEIEARRSRRRAAHRTSCPLCGRPTWTGPDDTPSGPQTNIVTLDRARLTHLGMYQAATAGRHIYTLRHSKAGRQIDWLGEIAQPDPERDHLLVGHICGPDHIDRVDEPAEPAIDGPPPF